MLTEKSHTPPPQRLSSLPAPGDATLINDGNDVTYPEGGLKAWLVVFGAWSALAASLGVYNSTGVIEAYLSRELLRDESPSTIGWIFGVYAFMTWFCGAQVGPTFDAKGPRGLLIAGSLCTLIGIFALSFSTGKQQTRRDVPSWMRRTLRHEQIGRGSRYRLPLVRAASHANRTARRILPIHLSVLDPGRWWIVSPHHPGQ